MGYVIFLLLFTVFSSANASNYCEDYLREDDLEDRFSKDIANAKKYPGEERFAKKQDPFYISSIKINRKDTYSLYAYDDKQGFALNQRLLAELDAEDIRYSVEKKNDKKIYKLVDSSIRSGILANLTANQQEPTSTETTIYTKENKLIQHIWEQDHLRFTTEFTYKNNRCIPLRRIHKDTKQKEEWVELDIRVCRDLKDAFRKRKDLTTPKYKKEMLQIIKKVFQKYDIENLRRNSSIDFDLYKFRRSVKHHDGYFWYIDDENPYIAKAFDMLASCYMEPGFKGLLSDKELWRVIPKSLDPKDHSGAN